MISKKLEPYGTSIFSEMTKLAIEHGAVNLSQGFPDFSGPPEMIEAVARAMREGHNQYARSMGHLELVEALADRQAALYGLRFDPLTEVVVTSGATEAIASTMLGLLDPGDEVILIEPFYDSYPACLAMAGAVPRYVTLRFPRFELDLEALSRQINGRTRAILINTPHNPTGKVFERHELEAIAELAIRHDLTVITDEVYEHLTYDGAEHTPIATLPGMRERTLTISSAGKTFSFTGWKIGWAFGPPHLTAAIQAAHQFVTFATSTPMQVGLARTLRSLPSSFYGTLASEYLARRDRVAAVLEEVGFELTRPRGTYFIVAAFGRLFLGDDRAFARHLIEKAGVAAIPPSVFYAAQPDEGRRLVRFAFCKKDATLDAAAERLRRIRPA
ncbi:MAG: aminotransferase class I/II-fold pyridoxal phosphate-dependent enzyme [Deltaproteobacteria bacterium]|nr:aminotransferase class I/II-fold pyridoxal phosphate-dependent enzyme [Deltaproteobacteria bacterium]